LGRDGTKGLAARQFTHANGEVYIFMHQRLAEEKGLPFCWRGLKRLYVARLIHVSVKLKNSGAVVAIAEE
jgi:hypothetical protein